MLHTGHGHHGNFGRHHHAQQTQLHQQHRAAVGSTLAVSGSNVTGVRGTNQNHV